MAELKPCPFCGGTNVKLGAFSISPDCYVICNDCGASIEKSVAWGNMNTKEHDQKCLSVLTEAWNRRAEDGRDR